MVAGTRYCRTGGLPGVVRWGQPPGSVYLADQKLPVPVPRVRDRVANRESPLTTYERLQVPRAADAGLFRKVRVGLTCRQYAAWAEAVPEAFGLSASSVSRRFIRASARHLQTFCEGRVMPRQPTTLAKLTRPKLFRVVDRDRLFTRLDQERQGRPIVWTYLHRHPHGGRCVFCLVAQWHTNCLPRYGLAHATAWRAYHLRLGNR